MEFEVAQEQAPFGSVAIVSTPEKFSLAKRRRSNSISALTSLTSPGSKENYAKTPPTSRLPSSCPKRRRNESGSGKTFWGWSPSRGRFKPKVKDRPPRLRGLVSLVQEQVASSELEAAILFDPTFHINNLPLDEIILKDSYKH